jgi:hypothetical protein
VLLGIPKKNFLNLLGCWHFLEAEKNSYPFFVLRSGVTPGCCSAADGAAAGYCASPEKDVVTDDLDSNVQ